MANAFWQKVDEIFPLVADMTDTAARSARLRELCGTDEFLYSEISAMLAVEEKAENFIETPVNLPDSLSRVFAAAHTATQPTLKLAGRKIGAYRIKLKLGEGGMGVVYLAERADGEFYKKVAVKVVKNGADTALNLRRFRHERQILAALEHPFIARLIDGGTTEEGSPFLVMEYVEGEPLFDFCKKRALDLRGRLSLFRQICEALAYAHEKGVVHRDIKPGNILVTREGKIKLLDFGIAKILDPALIQDSAAIPQTETFFRQMTPEYASPEQICGEPVTPSTDIYSLGVVLYELVTGERPYKFTSRAPHEIARVICEQEVSSPKLNAETPLADDLKFIVLKSLQKKPSERYASIADFDRDISRFLEGVPILTEGTRLALFEKAAGDTGGAPVSLAIAPFRILAAENGETVEAPEASDFLSIGLADALTTRLSNVRKICVRPTSSVLRLAAEDTDAREIGKRLNTDFVLTGHILRADSSIRVSVQLLKISDESVFWAENFDEPETDIFRLQDSISERVAAALMPQLKTEERELLRHRGTTEPKAFEAYLRGRVSYLNYTFDGIAGAERYFKEAIAHDRNFAPAHSGLADFYNLQTIAGLISNREGFSRAKESARKAIELDQNLAEAYTSLAFATWAYDWDFVEAERLFQKSIRLNPNYPTAREWYAFLLFTSERHDEAFEQMQRAERLDPNSPATAAMFALVLYNARRYEEALEKARRAIELDPNYYIAQQSLGWVCPPLGKFDEAIEGCRRAVEISDEASLNKLSLALALVDAGQTEEARAIAAEIEARRQKQEIPAYYSALIYAALDENDKAFYWLDRAIGERGYWILRMRTEPRLDKLREDPRFAERLEKIKPLQKSKTTGNFASYPTDKFQPNVDLKNRKTFVAAAAVFVCIVLLFAAASFKFGTSKKTESPDEIATIADSTGESGESEKPRTDNAAADSLYLDGKKQLAARTADGIDKAIEFFAEAISLDPDFALAFSGLADAHIIRAGGKKNPADYRKAEEYAVKALALDPDLAEARISLGMAKFRNTNDFAAAEKHFIRAIEINPSLAAARHWYSVILAETGNYDAALREIEIAARLEPRSAVIQHSLAELYLKFERYDEAIEYFDKTIEIDNNFAAAYYWKSLVQQYRGEYDAALDTYRKARIYRGSDENEPLWLLMQAQTHASHKRKDEALTFLNRYLKSADYRKHPGQYPHEIALVYSLLGETEKAFEWLAKIEIKNRGNIRLISADPRFADLHDNPRFTQLVEKWRNESAKQ